MNQDTKKYIITSSNMDGVKRNLPLMLFRRNHEIIQGIQETLALRRKQSGGFFALYQGIVLYLSADLPVLIGLTLALPAILYVDANCPCGTNGCPPPNSPAGCGPAFTVLLLLLSAGALAFWTIYAILAVLSSPVGLIAIALDIIVGIIFSFQSSSESINTNDSNSAINILTQVQDEFVELKCQLESTQCQIKNSYIELKSMLEN
jgi:hypothetical protein